MRHAEKEREMMERARAISASSASAEYIEGLEQDFAAAKDRVDFLEAALEAKSQVYEEDMAALEEQLTETRRRVREALGWLGPDGAYQSVTPGERMRAVAALHDALSAAPAGQVLWRATVGWEDDPDGLGRPCVTIPQSARESLSFALAHHELDEGKFSLAVLTIRAMTEQGAE